MPVGPVPEESIGSLRSCLVEGDSLQERRARRSKQRALFISIVVQFLILAALVLFPLFSKGENIVSRVFVPTVPYSAGRARASGRAAPRPRRYPVQPSHFYAPTFVPPTVTTQDPDAVGEFSAPDGPEIPGVPSGPVIPGTPLAMDVRHDNSVPPPPPHRTERLKLSEPVIAARIIRRIEPVYPPIALQIRHQGRVELHAIIATDGTIQSLEVLNGDPLFFQSALAAVREWRYQPTILDGQPIEVDTHITVVYTLKR